MAPSIESDESIGVDPFLAGTHIAYFSMEIALHPEVHTYSGGLGILAGDTARAASDLELPMVFVTLVSHHGYLRQVIDAGGRQIEHPDPWEVGKYATALPAMIAIQIERRPVWIRPWLYVLGGPTGHRIPVILLDTDLAENAPQDRHITDGLYDGGDVDRLKQEMVLGIGGERILRALGFSISTFHLNEGHAALLTLALLKRSPRNALHSAEAEPYDADPVIGKCIFTTHTPVEAGHDQFDYALVESVLGKFIDLRTLKRFAGESRLNMTRLALNLSGYVNGVARRHAETAARMFPGYRVNAITNGVHVSTWAHPAFAALYQELGGSWAHDPDTLARADGLADHLVLDAHAKAKADLLSYIGSTTGRSLSPDLPILAFARRMTGYKRPELLFSDPERLRRLAQRHPFQLVIAGKAHPADVGGKLGIERLHAHLAQLADTIPGVFVPNYDWTAARHLVSGCDIWVNTPMPPLEASGTSGMKAAVNGVLNLSVLDGWWVEGWEEGVTGWAVGSDHDDPAGHADALYRKLEHEVLPLYYTNRGHWAWMMKQAISKIGSRFTSQRMMRRYAAEAYLR